MVLATVLLDKLLHLPHVINVGRETYRMKNRLKMGIQTILPATISAKQYLLLRKINS